MRAVAKHSFKSQRRTSSNLGSAQFSHPEVRTFSRREHEESLVITSPPREAEEEEELAHFAEEEEEEEEEMAAEIGT